MAMMLLLQSLVSADAVGLVVAGIFVVLILAPFFQAKLRRRSLERVAREIGFSFHATTANLGPKPYLSLPLLKESDGLSNILVGSVATGEVVVLDCKIGSGRSTYTLTVACLRLAGKQLPAFEMRPEKIFDKIGSVLGYRDIDFRENESFSRSYLLRGTDEAAVRELFHTGRLTFFEQHKGWIIEGKREWLGIYKQRKPFGQSNLIRPSKMRGFVEEVTQVATAFL